MSGEDWRQATYERVFEQVRAHIGGLRLTDPEFSIDRLRRLLQTEYVSQGNDWIGRGTLAHIIQAARIAAYESILAEWEGEPPGA